MDDFKNIEDLVKEHNPIPIKVDTTTIFQNELSFESKEAVVDWVRQTGRRNGIVVVVRRSDLNAQKRTPRIMLGCERSGGYRGSHMAKKRRTSTRKCSCPFTLKAYLNDSVAGSWGLVVVNGNHNHDLIKEMEGHSYVGRLSKEEKETVERLSLAGVKSRDILNHLKLKDPTNASTLKTVYNARTAMKIHDSRGRSHMQQLFKLLSENGYVCRHRSEATTGIVQDLYWSSSGSIQLAKAFPFVFMLDCTYKTNKYRLPLLEIVGVTSTQKTFAVSFCYMVAEKEENYIWALQCFKGLFEGGVVPSVFITDRELALMNALKIVFPTGKNLLCRVHIERNVLTNCISVFPLKENFDNFMKMWTSIMHATSIDEYNATLEKLQSSFSNYPKALSYINDSWLSKYKEAFVSAWVDKHFHLGCTTTNRVEGSHAKLKKYLTNSVNGFVESFNKIHLLLTGQITDIKASFEDSLTRVPLRFRKPLFNNLIGNVSTAALEIIEKEIASLGKGVDASHCNHHLLSTFGLPCAHLLTNYMVEERSISLNEVHSYWKKLSITPFVADPREEDVNIEAEMNLIYNLFAISSLPQKLELKKQLQQFGKTTNNTLLEPKPKVNVRGRSKLKKGKKVTNMAEQSTKREPSAFEVALDSHVFEADMVYASQISSTSTTAMFLNPKKFPPKLTIRRTRHVDTKKWVEMFPDFLQKYISNIIDVPGDGHCGYRVVSSYLGWDVDGWKKVRMELVAELECHKEMYDKILRPLSSTDELLQSVQTLDANVERDKWLIMPYMGNVIANCFNVVVLLLSDKCCLSFFPLINAAPSEYKEDIMAFGFINSNHFVRLQLAANCPIPPVSRMWTDHHQECAQGWADLFATRMEIFRSLKSVNHNDMTIIDLVN